MTTPIPMTERPKPGPAPQYNFPNFERRKLSNGLEVITAPVHKLPVVTVLAVFDAGSIMDPSGKEGVAQIAARALVESDPTLAEKLEMIGTSAEAGADWDSATVGLTVLTSKLSDALKLFADIITKPAFPAREIERLKAERVAELLQLESEPRGLADEMFERFLYDAGSRYSKPDGGSKESVSALKREDVVEFYKSAYRPSNCKLIIVGDVESDAVVKLVEGILGSWAGAGSASQKPVGIGKAARTERALQIVARNEAPQSELRVGHLGVPRNHPDYFPLVILNSVLGGLFSSRINLNLREVHGYTYGASSYFDWRKDVGPFVVSTAVQSEVTAPAVKEILLEIDRIRAAEISADELSLATSYLAGVFPIRFETTGAIAAALATLVVYELPEDWYDNYRSNITSITQGDVLRAADAHLKPEQLQIVVVGNPAVIQAPLNEINFAPAQVAG